MLISYSTSIWACMCPHEHRFSIHMGVYTSKYIFRCARHTMSMCVCWCVCVWVCVFPCTHGLNETVYFCDPAHVCLCACVHSCCFLDVILEHSYLFSPPCGSYQQKYGENWMHYFENFVRKDSMIIMTELTSVRLFLCTFLDNKLLFVLEVYRRKVTVHIKVSSFL